jgi:hypothetical protein
LLRLRGSTNSEDRSSLHTCKTTYSHLYSQGVWLFGDWDKALRAAGFAPEQMRMWGFKGQAKLISQIQRLRKRNLPLYAKYVLDDHKKLFSAALRQFGTAARESLETISFKSFSGTLPGA